MSENYYALTRLADANRAAELRRADAKRATRAGKHSASPGRSAWRGSVGAAVVRAGLKLGGGSSARRQVEAGSELPQPNI